MAICAAPADNERRLASVASLYARPRPIAHTHSARRHRLPIMMCCYGSPMPKDCLPACVVCRATVADRWRMLWIPVMIVVTMGRDTSGGAGNDDVHAGNDSAMVRVMLRR